MSQVAVLLKAGASVEAGVPASRDMTEAIVGHIKNDERREPGVQQALNYTVAAMTAHDSALGGGPYDGLDVERVFAAVQMLAGRASLEVAPFIANWSPVLDSIASDIYGQYIGDELIEAIREKLGGHVQDVFERGVEAIVGRSRYSRVFKDLEVAMIDALRTLLTVEPVGAHYLRPMLTGELPIRIATLNYDRVVEELCVEDGITLDTGISAWGGGFEWHWRADAKVHLLKLHGSIDWLRKVDRHDENLEEAAITVDQVGPRREPYGEAYEPVVVFGQRGKVRADGPFLAMLRALDTFLMECSRLVIIGYSFRDDHINTAIRRWFNLHQNRELTIVDPTFPDYRENFYDHPDFACTLFSAMTNNVDYTDIPIPGHVVHRLPASEALRIIFGSASDDMTLTTT